MEHAAKDEKNYQTKYYNLDAILSVGYRLNSLKATQFRIWAVKGKGWIFNYDKLKELNPEKKQDGIDKQMRDIWTMPLCQGKERLRGGR